MFWQEVRFGNVSQRIKLLYNPVRHLQHHEDSMLDIGRLNEPKNSFQDKVKNSCQETLSHLTGFAESYKILVVTLKA